MRVCVCLLVSVMLLVGCGIAPQPTMSDLAATAQIAGCWSGSRMPPSPVTVTPVGDPTPTAEGMAADPARPTMTPLPTTTPYVQCPAAPGVTITPWPTPLPPRPIYPTPIRMQRPNTTRMETIMQLPDAVLSVDVAVHPLTGDPVVAAIAAPLTNSGNPHAFVRAYNAPNQAWGTLQSVDIAASMIAPHRFRTVAVTVAADNTITVVYGVTKYPTMGLWSTTSRDTGETWTEPQLVMDNAFGVLDLAATLDGHVAVLVLQRTPLRPVLLTSTADGGWSKPDPLPSSVQAWYGSSGALVLTGDGTAAQVIALVTGLKGSAGTVYLARRPLDAVQAWAVDRRSVPMIGGDGLLLHARAISADQPATGAAQPVIGFTFAQEEAGTLYSVASIDGGRSWSQIAQFADAGTRTSLYSALAYDHATGHFVAFWSCCDDARWGSVASTHYSAWNVPGEAVWHPPQPIPVISGARAAADTALAQAANSQYAWLAWVEDGNSVAVRAFDLDRVIPAQQNPITTPYPGPDEVQP